METTDTSYAWSPEAIGVFERVRTHLLTQAVPATMTASTGECMYRIQPTENGLPVLRCAVGCLITDEAYDPKMEGYGISSVACSEGRWTDRPSIHLDGGDCVLAGAMNASGIPASIEVLSLLIDLQRVHDTFNPIDWEEVLGTHPTGLHDRLDDWNHGMSPHRAS